LTGVSAVILAGGRGIRLGGVDKSAIRIGGRTILDRLRASLSTLVDEFVFVVNRPIADPATGDVVVSDPEPHGGVLPALLTGLRAAGSPLCFVLAVDMPFVDPRVVALMLREAEHADVVIAVVDGRHEPMHAVYRRAACINSIEAAIARGDRRMISFFDDVRVQTVPESSLRAIDPDLRTLFNVNTPEDLRRAESLAGA
jgi:molybdopterin-guanine dinucleotide biosynthesis protein A